MTDGKRTGTGGGNHFVLSGATPSDSPFLRKARAASQPDPVLAQPSRRCPICSRACSSAHDQRKRRAWTKPATTSSTSSRSRSNRHNRRSTAGQPPWLVDRTLRNILIDVTGNTHRSEFCIDKIIIAGNSTRTAGP